MPSEASFGDTLNPELPILDAHVHFWDPRGTPRVVTPLVRAFGFSPRLVDWLARRVFPRNALTFFAKPEHITRPYLPASFDADRAHHSVAGLVHVEASWQGRGPLGPVGETRWLAELGAEGAGRVSAIVAHADLGLGRGVGEVLQAHLAASDRVRGVRDTLSWHASSDVLNGASAPNRSEDPTWRAGFEQLRRYGLSFDATVYDSQLDEITELARAYPEQVIVLCHLGTPVGIGGQYGEIGRTPSERAGILGRWQEAMSRLAECANVRVKLSGLTMPVCGFGYERRETPPTAEEVAHAIGPLVTFAIDSFGVERCMFASNFPVDKVSHPYAVLFDAFSLIVGDRTRHERLALFRDNAARCYCIEDTR